MRIRNSVRAAVRGRQLLSPRSRQPHRQLFTFSRQQAKTRKLVIGPAILFATGTIIWLDARRPVPEAKKLVSTPGRRKQSPSEHRTEDEGSAWSMFTASFEDLSNVTDVEWAALSDRIVDYILPEWSKVIPVYLRKLQQDLSAKPGSLANEIWREAHDPFVNPEIQYSAHVRVSEALCDEEKEFRRRRKQVAKIALAKYLGINEGEVHPDDVPTIAVCGSGGGLRALVAGAGSLLAAEKDGLLDCVTYTAGVSGSCWLQAIHFSSIGRCSMQRVLDHLKGRIGTHIAYPPVALQTLVSAPTGKYVLSGMVEKLRADAGAAFGLVDIYGLLLAARLLVPVGDLEVDSRDLKISSQQNYIKFGQNPLPIYTAVRHEIPQVVDSEEKTAIPGEDAKRRAESEPWFQWFEITPYEFFCEEFSAGIPSWAMGRKFEKGTNVLPEGGLYHPEFKMSLLMGVLGSAFCATLSHYYREIRPVVKGLTGFGTIDEMICGRDRDLIKLHPIDPAILPNFVYGMEGKLPGTVPESIYKDRYIQLMDAGMSNNLPIYPLLRPGREVDIIISFDNSADIKQDNWLAVTDGYARQRNIKGWPVGVGWPKGVTAEEAQRELSMASEGSHQEPKESVTEAGYEAASRQDVELRARKPDHTDGNMQDKMEKDLGYCTIWVGTKEELTTSPPQPRKALDSSEASWSALSSPNAGLALVYLPLLTNPRVPGIDPKTTDFLSTWNFVYTPEQVSQVADLAKANYDEGKEQIRRCVKAVYERKKKLREEREEKERMIRYRSLVRKGLVHPLGEGDHFT